MALERKELYKVPDEHIVDGLVFPTIFPESALQKIKQMTLYDDDVLLATYPKCGTTWMQEIIYLLCSDGDYATAKKVPLNDRFPFVEMCRSETPNIDMLDARSPPRLMKTHLYSHFFEKGFKRAKPKTVIVFRNPKDCLVSYYHFYRGNRAFGHYTGDFTDFLELYKHKWIVHGDPFDFSLSWWEHRQKDNVMFTHFEAMKKDAPEVIRKVAKFLGKSVSEEAVKEIAAYTSFEKMRKNPMTNHADTPEIQMTFMRKGVVGDWMNYFNDEQSEMIDEKAKEVEKSHGLKFMFD